MGSPWCHRESFKNTPRYFTEVVGFIFWLLTLKFKCLVITWCFLLNIIGYFSLEIICYLLRIHWQKSFKSLWFSCRFAHILIGCIIFLSLFLDLDVVTRLSMSTVFFLTRLWACLTLAGILCLQNACFLWPVT